MSDHDPTSQTFAVASKEKADYESPRRLLSSAMLRLRSQRVPSSPDAPFYVRYDRSMGGSFAQLWFLTRGCSWDRAGACTMCNYGHAAHVSADEMVSYVQRGLASIDRPLDELYVSPSGSLLDVAEVPLEARHRILTAIADVAVRRFSFETRPETVTPEVVGDIVETLPRHELAVGFGLESADPYVLEYCLNKPGTTSAFPPAAKRLSERGVAVYANVALGSPFLSTGEAVDDAVATVTWAHAHGADIALVFPMHVKSNTLLAWLYQRGRYRPPSLWSLIEVLERLDRSVLSKVQISWYRSDYGSSQNVIASPTTCPRCERDVLLALDRYRSQPSDLSLSTLQDLWCDCRERWRRELARTPELPLAQRVQAEHALLEAHLLGG